LRPQVGRQRPQTAVIGRLTIGVRKICSTLSTKVPECKNLTVSIPRSEDRGNRKHVLGLIFDKNTGSCTIYIAPIFRSGKKSNLRFLFGALAPRVRICKVYTKLFLPNSRGQATNNGLPRPPKLL
jgi:hypothetical protein